MPDQFNTAQTRANTGVVYDEGLRAFMLGVYNYMALGVAATGLIAYFFVNNPELTAVMRTTPLRWVPFVGILGIGFIAPRVIFSGSRIAAHSMYWVYIALWAAMIGPIVAVYAGMGMAQEVYKSFFITAIVFGSVSLLGYTTKKDLAPMGKFMFMAAVGLIIAMILNVLVFKSGLMSVGISALVVIVFSAITAYETQMIKNLYHEQGGEENSRASIFGAFALYGSFATLFIHILNLMGFMRD